MLKLRKGLQIDSNILGNGKELVYKILQEPTREKFIDIIDNGFGELDNLDFKEQWIDHQKIAEIILGIANSGGGAVIFGVKENDDGTLSATGLNQLEDKEKVHSKIQKFLPDILEFSIYDFDFNGENYSKVNGKLFQILCINSKEIELPYVWKKDSNGAEAGCIFYRRGTKTIKANMQEIQDMIDKRIEAAYMEESSLQLEEHLKQLSTLYNNLMPYKYSLNGLFRGINSLTAIGSARIAGTKNPCYPDESYEEFIARMIEQKKKKIEKVLDLRQCIK